MDKQFVIDTINLAVTNSVLTDFCHIKNGSHNKYGGLVTVWFEEDDEDGRHDLRKVNPSLIWSAMEQILENNNLALDEESEKRILLSHKRKDVFVMENDDILTIFKLALTGEVE
jgi:hypothetical protein